MSTLFTESLGPKHNDLLLFRTSDGVNIDFVYYPYPPLHRLVKSELISLFNIQDLASNKAYTVGRRATWRDYRDYRDYVDVFFLLKWGICNINNMVKEAKKDLVENLARNSF
jgi:hypothetical protein